MSVGGGVTGGSVADVAGGVAADVAGGAAVAGGDSAL